MAYFLGDLFFRILEQVGSGFIKEIYFLGEQLIVDIERYKSHPDCRTLICFVYDPAGIIKNPRGIENDLNGRHAELEVKVIIVPKGF